MHPNVTNPNFTNSKSSLHTMQATALEESPISSSSGPHMIINPPKRHPTWVGFHAPLRDETVVTRPRMNSCGDVQEIYASCLAQRSTDDVCKAAISYLGICRGIVE
jgi:hypothetical protein